ncbi:hypothetical protein QQ045_026199 [Rhodiola kirilowii]
MQYFVSISQVMLWLWANYKSEIHLQLQKLKNHLQMRQGREGEKSCGFSFDGDEEESIKAEYMTGFDEDEPTSLLNVVESGDGSLSCSAENWGGLSTDSLFDESGSSYQWWDSLP